MSEPVGSAEEHHGNLTPRAASASTGRRADAATHYRGLTDVEIAALESRGCRCARWQDVQVAEGSSAERVERVYFSGSVRIASQSGTVTFRLTDEYGSLLAQRELSFLTTSGQLSHLLQSTDDNAEVYITLGGADMAVVSASFGGWISPEGWLYQPSMVRIGVKP